MGFDYYYNDKRYQYTIRKSGNDHDVKLKVAEGEFVRIYVFPKKLTSNNEIYWNYIPSNTRIFHMGAFYNKSKVRGIGKSFLIFILKQLLNDDDFLTLEASGNNELSNEIEEECNSHKLNIRQILNELVLNYPMQLMNICYDNALFKVTPTRKLLQQSLCRCIAAEGLVKYYQSMGFKLLQPSVSADSWMGIKISDLHI
jgi:hypothetical protein